MNHLPSKLIEYVYLKSNIRSDNWKKGSFDIEGVFIFLKVFIKFLKQLLNRKIIKIYLLLSSGKIGFLRDSLYILFSFLFNKKIILHYRGGNFDGFYNKCNWLFKKYITIILNLSRAIIVQAEILKKMFDEITKTEVKVLYNGLTVKSDFEKKKFLHKENTMLFMGHLTFSKGFYDLIKVYKKIHENYNLKLIFAGTFISDGKSARTQSAFLNGDVLKFYNENSEIISSEIKYFVENAEKYNAMYLGIVSGVEKEYAFNNSDLFILPSYTEGFSLAVLEALSKGLPVIVSDSGAFPEIIKENENGWFVKPGDCNNIEKKIIFAFDNKEKFTDISDNNRNYFIKNFNIKNIAKTFETILFEA